MKWFKAKRYGWGWYPCSLEGWMITLIFSLILAGMVVLFQRTLIFYPEHTSTTIPLFAVSFLLIVGALIWICYKKGEHPRWRWG